MKIVQSYWSKPISNDYGWNNKIFHYMSWALSCLRLKQLYPKVELITDEEGEKLLVNTLDLPYDSVNICLEVLDGYSPKLWTLGKVYSYSIQTEPFIHVDGDVFIWKKFSKKIENATLIAQHKEVSFKHNILFMNLLLANHFCFSDKISPTDTITEVNAGILGGSNLSFFKKYTDEVLLFINSNRDQIDKISDKNSAAVNTILEQYMFYSLAQYYNIEISYYYKEGIVTDDYCKLVDFTSLPFKNSYIHTVGYHKGNHEMGERIARCLWYEFPKYYEKIIDLTKRGLL